MLKLKLDFFLAFSGSTLDIPVIKEWFVYPGNPLKEPDTVHPVPVNFSCTVHAYPNNKINNNTVASVASNASMF